MVEQRSGCSFLCMCGFESHLWQLLCFSGILFWLLFACCAITYRFWMQRAIYRAAPWIHLCVKQFSACYSHTKHTMQHSSWLYTALLNNFLTSCYMISSLCELFTLEHGWHYSDLVRHQQQFWIWRLYVRKYRMADGKTLNVESSNLSSNLGVTSCWPNAEFLKSKGIYSNW